MSTLRRIFITDSADPTRLAGLDYKTNKLIVVDYGHHQLHFGHVFCVTTNDTGNNNERIEFVITPPAVGVKEFHVLWEYSTNGAGQFDIIEGVTYSSGGASTTPINHNRNSSTVSTCTSCYVGKVATPITKTGGTTIRTETFGSGRTAGQQAVREREWIIKGGVSTAFVLTSKAANINLWMTIEWYEHTSLI